MTRPETLRKMKSTRNVHTGIAIQNARQPKKANHITHRQILLILVLLLIFMGTGIGYVWSNFGTTQIGYDIIQLKKEEMRLEAMNKMLRLELAILKLPQTLEPLGTHELGLKQPKPEQIVVLP